MAVFCVALPVIDVDRRQTAKNELELARIENAQKARRNDLKKTAFERLELLARIT